MTSPVPTDALGSLAASLGKGERGLYGSRSERKFVVTPEVAAALRATVAVRMALEQFVPGRQRTLIHSIYFDSPDFELFRRSLQGDAALSLKLRLRSYGDAATPGTSDAARFLEAKVGATSADGMRLKHKARLPLDDAALATVLGLPGAAPAFVPGARKKFWRPLLAIMGDLAIQPCLTVSYEREAFVDTAGLLRVTLDADYHASPVIAGAVTPLAGPAGRLGDARIVEIKCVGALPAWLEAALVQLGLDPAGERFSKFKTAVPLLFAATAR
jgi:hypothetical protein